MRSLVGLFVGNFSPLNIRFGEGGGGGNIV